MKIKFYKMHGAGNDYIYIDAINQDIDLDLFTSKIPKLSNRRFGIGGDGVVFITKSDVADVQMRMFNLDGSEGNMCGNASICIIKLISELKLNKSDTIKLQTIPGIVEGTIKNDGKVKVKMFYPPKIDSVEREIVSSDKTFKFHKANIGNPHCIINYLDVDGMDIEKYGKPIENNIDVFPNKVNVEFYNEIESAVVKMRVWERGSGETLACGTGAACVAGVYREINDNKYNEVIVKVLGGELKYQWQDDDFYMIGIATHVCRGEFESDDF